MKFNKINSNNKKIILVKFYIINNKYLNIRNIKNRKID